MFRNKLVACLGLTAGMTLGFTSLRAADDGELRKEVQELKKEIEALRKDKAASKPMASSNVDKAIDNKYGPNATVTTKEGKLTISGLVQIWYQHIQNDNHGRFFDSGAFPGVSNLPMGAVTWNTPVAINRTYIGPNGGSQISGQRTDLARGDTGVLLGEFGGEGMSTILAIDLGGTRIEGRAKGLSERGELIPNL